MVEKVTSIGTTTLYIKISRITHVTLAMYHLGARVIYRGTSPMYIKVSGMTPVSFAINHLGARVIFRGTSSQYIEAIRIETRTFLHNSAVKNIKKASEAHHHYSTVNF